jgi:hypothetical protein
MDLGDILRTIGRRWYIMLPIVLVTVAVTVGAYLQIPTEYQSTSQISLLSPQQPASGAFKGQSNPFLIFDTSLTSTADLLARNLSSDGTAKELEERGVTEEYTAKLADFAQGPFLSFTVTGTDKDHVLASTRTVTAFAEERLREIQRQNGVPSGNMIMTTVMIPPQPPQPQTKDKLQKVLALFAAGIVAAFMATFVTEGLLRSRNRGPASTSVIAAAPGKRGIGTGMNSAAAVDPDETAVLSRATDPDRARAAGPTSQDTAPLDRIVVSGRPAVPPWLTGPVADVTGRADPRPHNGNGASVDQTVRGHPAARVYRSSATPGGGGDTGPYAGG